MTSRRGVTLLELLLVLILSAGFAAALHAVVRLAAVQATIAVQRSAATRDHVALWALISRDLAHASASDVQVPSSTALEFDRPVLEGPACASLASAVMLRSAPDDASRLPVAGRDQLLLLAPGPTGAWLRRGIVSVAMANCPDTGPALLLSTDTPIPAIGFARVTEPVRLRSYPSGGAHAIGLEGRLGTTSIQPLAGPIGSTNFDVLAMGHSIRLTVARQPLPPLTLMVPVRPGP